MRVDAERGNSPAFARDAQRTWSTSRRR